MKKVKFGFLPLYVKLYDEALPHLRPRLEAFYEKAAAKLEARGFEVLRAPFCRVESEVEAAIGAFEAAGAACVVTIHMAYSPSLEAARPLSRTALPVAVFDTTETLSFGFSQNPEEILYNHGIHGVMDLCAVLKQRGKRFSVCAGHWEDEGTLSRMEAHIRAAAAAGALSSARVGSIGGPFEGMGDFFVSDGELRRTLGAQVVRLGEEDLPLFDVCPERAEAEAALWRERFDCEADGETLLASAAACLGVRAWMEARGLTALTVNFRDVRASTRPDVMPFVEACLAMERGIGYAGEGDTLTAALTGALLSAGFEASFVEIFCPDWAGGTLFLSHMGEMNTALAAKKPLLVKANFPYTDAPDPAALRAAFRPGEAVYANLTPGPEGYALALSSVTMEYGDDAFTRDVRGWMRPRRGVEHFLEEHSNAGAGHHSVLVYGDALAALKAFGAHRGFKTVVI